MINPSDKEFINALEVGDVAVVEDRNHLKKVLVKKVTRTTVVIEYNNNGYEMRFKKDNCKLIGSDVWLSSYLVEPTDERLNEIERRSKAAKVNTMLKKINPTKLGIKELDSLMEWLPKFI